MSIDAPSITPDEPYYRPCVGAVLFNSEGLVWIGKRAAEPSDMLDYAWQMPQGGIDAGETPEVAVLRELKEETGSDNAEIIGECRSWLNYDLPDSLLRKRRNGLFRGQTQKWFALRFKGDDSEFDLDGHDRPEFSAWRWERLEAVPELIVPFKRGVYKQVVDEFEGISAQIAGR